MTWSSAALECPELVRHVHESGVAVYRSALLDRAGFAHGFSTRHGGVSAPPFDTLNLGIAQAPGEPDSEANVARNVERLMAAIGAPECAMVRARQVHGVAVHWAERGAAGGAPVHEADVVASAWRGAAPCVRTADCVPLLLACTATGMVAAVHAGWRGVVAGAVRAAVAALTARGARAEDLAAAIGPSISAAEYEVGEEVARAFEVAGLEAHVLRRASWPRPHVDCAGAVRAQLRAVGVPGNRIEGGGLCTARMPREFFSYRRDGARSGRMAAVIVPRG
jgi:YfiH family protein